MTDAKVLEEEGVDSEGAVTSKSKLQSKVKALSGVDILTATGEYKSTYEILSQISDVWEDISDIDQAALLELISGKRNSSVIAAILQAPEALKAAYEDAQNAEGSALEENAKYMDSIQGRIDQFNNAVQTMWTNLLDDDFVKMIVGWGTNIIKSLDTVHGKLSALIKIIAIMMTYKKVNPFDWLTNLSSNIKADGIITTLKNMGTSLLGIKTITKAVTAETIANTIAMQTKNTEEQKAILSTMGLTGATGALNAEMKAKIANNIADAVTSGQMTAAMGQQMAAMLGYTLSVDAAGKATVALDTTTKSFMATNPVGRILLIATAIMGVVTLVKNWKSSTEKLSEELSDLKSELSNIKTELDTVNSELETTNTRMSELLAMESLSFVEQEELSKLQKANAELERRKQLLGVEEERAQKRTAQKAQETVDSKMEDTSWDGDWKSMTSSIAKDMALYMSAGAGFGAMLGGVGAIPGAIIGAIVGVTSGIVKELTLNRISTEDKLNREIEEYDNLIQKRDDIQNKLVKADQTKGKFLWWETDSEYDQLKKELGNTEKEIVETEEYIDTTLKNIGTELEGVEYGQGADEAKNVYSRFKNRWEIAYGSDGAKATAIEDVMSRDQFADLSEQVDMYTAKLKEGDATAAQSIKSLIEGSQTLADELKANGLEVQDAVDYYTLDKGMFDSDTVKGVALQYDKGKRVIQQFADAARDSRKALGEAALSDDELKQMQNYQTGGNVDLFNRPTINPDLLVKSGWTDASGGEDMATVFTQTYQNAAGTVYANFTPILPNGKILTPDQLTIYAEEVCEGVREDDLKLQIGSEFSTKQAAEAAAENIHILQEKYYKDPITSEISFEVDGEIKKVNFDDLFEEGDDGKFTAKKEEFSEMLKGMDEDARETFISLSEKVKNGALTWNQAMDAMSAQGLVKSLEVMNSQISSINSEMFSDVAGELSGLIDTFGELSKVLESTASSMELVHAAQTQMNNSGRISVKTALELMQSTDNWNEILEIEEGNVRLATDAEQKLIGAKLDHIKVNLQNALATVEAQIAAVEATGTSVDFATTLDESTNIAVQELSKSMITLVELMKAYKDGTSTEDAMARADDQIAKLDQRLNTYKGPKLTKTQALSNLNQQKENIQAMLSMYDGIDTPSEFKNYYDYDKTPGDKYDDSGDSKTAFELMQERHEREIAALEHRQDLIQGDIDILEAQRKGVSSSYYKQLIAGEDAKIDAYERQLKESQVLLANTSKTDEEYNEIVEHIWDIEKGLQEAALAAIEFGEVLNANQLKGIQDIGDAYENLYNINDRQKGSMELYKEGVEIGGGYVNERWYDDMIAKAGEAGDLARQELTDSLWAIDQYRNQKNPFEVGTAEYEGFEFDRNKNLQEAWAQAADAKDKIQEAENEALQLAEDKKDAYIEAWENVATGFERIGTLFENQISLIDGYESRLEALNINVSDAVYEKKIGAQKNILDNLDEQIAYDENMLAEYAAKYGTNDERYLAKWEELNDKRVQRYEAETEIVQIEQQIIDNQIDRFNQTIDRMNNVVDKMNNVASLIADEDVADENGDWTAEGLTRAGMSFQEMAYQKENITAYADQMEELTKLYNEGKISEKEYYEQMKELEDGQWSAIEAYKSAEDAIIELEEARIDALENGLQEEIDSYKELIDLKKEELDAERDLFEFRRDVEDQSKNIAEIERRIASLSGSSSDEDRAEMKRLQKELSEANRGLDDTYRNHSYDQTSQALDDELSAFENSYTDYIDRLRESLENTDELIKQIYSDVVTNGQLVLETLVQLSDEHGFTLDENLTAPWRNANGESLTFEEDASAHYNHVKTTVELGTAGFVENIEKPWKRGQEESKLFASDSEKYLQSALDSAIAKQEGMTTALAAPWENMKELIAQGPTWVSTAAAEILTVVRQNVAEINAEYAKITMPSAQTSGASGGSGSGSGSGGKQDTVNIPPAITKDATNLQYYLNTYHKAGLPVTGYYGDQTTAAVKKLQKTIGATVNGKYDAQTVKKLQDYWAKSIKYTSQEVSWGASELKDDLEWMKKAKAGIPKAYYAKGTTGTKRDEWAVTDEYGPELTLIPGKNGNLSFMRAGTGVVPAELTKRLMEMAQMPMGEFGNVVKAFVPNVESNTNAVNISFDALVKTEHIDSDIMGDVEKMVEKQLNNFTQKLNYAIKRTGGR